MKRISIGRTLMSVTILLLALVTLAPSDRRDWSNPIKATEGNELMGPPLPRWREGGTPYNPFQALRPYAVSRPRMKDEPRSGLIESPPEYDPVRGVIFWYQSGAWPYVVRDLVVALTSDEQHDEIAYVVVTSTSQMNSAISLFTAGGADMSKVEFIIEPGNSIWIRDYGPHFIWQDGALSIVDSHYYPSRSLDNFIPTLLGDDHFLMPTYDMGLYYSGGNFLAGPGRSGFVTSLVNLDNPSSEGFDADLIAELYRTYQGIDTLHVMPQLPPSVDGTGHIDMWMYLVDDSTAIISSFKPGSNPTAIQITDDAANYMEGLGFNVYRTPAWNVGYTHYTYTNSFRANDRIFVSTYGDGNPDYQDEDSAAIDTWKAAAGPGVTIVPINCYDIIPAAGAIHCIVMQVPCYTDPEPTIHLISPRGGEFFASGTSRTISWVASDSDNVIVPQIDLYYSVDGGESYELIGTTADSGSYEWTVPYLSTEEAKIRVVATSADMDQSEAITPAVFQIGPASQTVYDFTSGGGVDRFGWGYQTSSWYAVDGTRSPVTTDIESHVTGAYSKMAYSDASGGDSDPNRYTSDPWNGYESTHTFEFTIGEDPEDIDDIEISWEGYADQCTQVEMYIWDYVAEQWSDGRGFFGQNRFVDSWAGNRDGFLETHIRADIGRYIDVSGQMTLLLYAERGSDKSFQDYLRLVVSCVNRKPYQPTSPSPYDGEIEVEVTATLSWTGGDPDQGDTVTYDIYFGTETPPPQVAWSESLPAYNPGTMDHDTVYYWQIVALDSYGDSTSGPIWNFRTEAVQIACGDCNGDERVTVADAVYIVSYIYGSGPAPLGEGDVNVDTRITVADAVYLVGYIYGGGPAPCEPPVTSPARQNPQAQW